LRSIKLKIKLKITVPLTLENILRSPAIQNLRLQMHPILRLCSNGPRRFRHL
jgi:hypothetical protein